ncbi:MAG: hypothetical protein KZQ85_10980 [Candidatus Thiodiazotropha sp. (ex Myrtea sp. 'scaly one' KF741663)]|nr:hypothetical protein [Candidatus Thiodiazotropha sp. (ex Myrtea sp. 'scaly one' KF741663)]
MKRKLLCMLVGMFISGGSIAGTWIIDTKIADVRWYTGDAGYITTENNSNPGCPGQPLNANRYLNSNTPGNEKLISLALSAMMAGKTVNVLLSGCFENKHSKISGIVVKSQ